MIKKPYSILQAERLLARLIKKEGIYNRALKRSEKTGEKITVKKLTQREIKLMASYRLEILKYTMGLHPRSKKGPNLSRS